MGKVVGSPHGALRVTVGACLLFIATVGPEGPTANAAPSAPAPLSEESEPHYRTLGQSNAQPAPAVLFPELARNANGLKHEWRLFDQRYWQIASPAGEDPEVTDRIEGNRGACAPGQVEVKGRLKQHFMLDALQDQACTNWISRKFPERCGEFDRDKWLELSKNVPSEPVHFCIDRFEFPNRKDVYPVIMVSWYEAEASCKSAGKRLCTENEWTFACEGEEAMPYPYGYKRDAEACVIDRPWVKYDDAALMPRNTERAMKELDRLWKGEPSGKNPGCKSQFGVYDMTGNVDEWTRSSIAGERPSVLKGGYWGPVRTRCRPATKAHGETHTFYQQGFRCCGNPGASTP